MRLKKRLKVDEAKASSPPSFSKRKLGL
jgi:hypothetical protein